MKVYVVCYEDISGVFGVFTTLDKAMRSDNYKNGFEPYIEEIELDADFVSGNITEVGQLIE